MLIGAHVSPAGGLAKAVARGTDLGARSIQIFNQSPRMWRPTAYGEEDFGAFREAMDASRIDAVLIHAVYLLNCASEDREIRDKSRASLIQSLTVGDEIGAHGVVLHAGSAKQGHAPSAIKRAGKVIAQALTETDHCPLHLEDTAGAGGTLGRTFEELADLIGAAGAGPRLGAGRGRLCRLGKERAQGGDQQQCRIGQLLGDLGSVPLQQLGGAADGAPSDAREMLLGWDLFSCDLLGCRRLGRFRIRRRRIGRVGRVRPSLRPGFVGGETDQPGAQRVQQLTGLAGQ